MLTYQSDAEGLSSTRSDFRAAWAFPKHVLIRSSTAYAVSPPFHSFVTTSRLRDLEVARHAPSCNTLHKAAAEKATISFVTAICLELERASRRHALQRRPVCTAYVRSSDCVRTCGLAATTAAQCPGVAQTCASISLRAYAARVHARYRSALSATRIIRCSRAAPQHAPFRASALCMPFP